MTDLEAARREKLRRLSELGVEPYPARCRESEPLAAVRERGETEEQVVVHGRMTARREHGKTIFADIRDGSGSMQLYLNRKVLPEMDWEVAGLTDLGDIVEAVGTVFTTRTGELTVRCLSLTVLCKSLRPLPTVKVDAEGVAHDRVTDPDLLYRHRCVDLQLNPGSVERFRTRSRIVSAMRSYLDRQGFMEVETPVLQPVYGGAAADPFVTEYTSMDGTFYLRIATELYLKRLVSGGLEKVYELGKDFRNEGVDRTHSPEFTQLELYEAYTDYEGMMRRMEELTREAAEAAGSGMRFEYRGGTVDLSEPFRRVPFLEALHRASGMELYGMDAGELRAHADELGIAGGSVTRVALLDKLFDHYVVRGITAPTFVVDYPAELSPLAKSTSDGSGLTERFEAFVMGLELANAFSEQNDPLAQRRVLAEQSAGREQGGGEVDEDFLYALEVGMPPTGGLGIGVDRLVMLLTDTGSIRDTILFPHLRRPGR